jgi:hypothetical protein
MCEVAPAPSMSESFLTHDRLSFVFFAGSRKRKRQVRVRSSTQQGDTSGRAVAWPIAGARLPYVFGGANTSYSLDILGMLHRGEIDQPKRRAWAEFRALCKRIPGGDHEPAIATLIAVGDIVSFRLTASPKVSIMWQGSSSPLMSEERSPGGFPVPEGSVSGLSTRHAEPALRRSLLTTAAYRA